MHSTLRRGRDLNLDFDLRLQIGVVRSEYAYNFSVVIDKPGVKNTQKYLTSCPLEVQRNDIYMDIRPFHAILSYRGGAVASELSAL